MKKHFFQVLACLTTLHASAQLSILQDKSGDGSLLIGKKASISINSGDESINGNLSYLKSYSNNKEWFVGIGAKFASTEGVAKLLDGYNFKPKTTVSLYGGAYFNSTNGNYNVAYFSIDFTNSYFNVLPVDTVPAFSEKHFSSTTPKVGFNRLSSFSPSVPYLLGASISFGKINNLEDLSEVEIDSFLIRNNKMLALQKDNGYAGGYIAENALKLNIDFYIYPQFLGSQIGVGGYLRGQLTGTYPRQNAGVGFIIGQHGAPSNIVMGLFYQFNDVFNQLNTDNNFLKRGGINLVAGYNL
jgi:hypothetical protein